jgi:hypothetical protein
MVKVIISTMVKDEEDVVKEWIEYHGKLVGFENLYIIDNYSSDNTYNICNEYCSRGVHLEKKQNYKEKGNYMTEYKNNIDSDIFIPIDIDEFICYYDKENKIISPEKTLEYLKELYNTNYGILKMNYLFPIRTNNNKDLSKFTHATYEDYKEFAKTFIIKKNAPSHLIFDHGNHYTHGKHFVSDLVLIHYTHRSHEQYIIKCINNVAGLGYSLNVNSLQQYVCMYPYCAGNHRIKMYIDIKKNPKKDYSPSLHTIIDPSWINIERIFQ